MQVYSGERIDGLLLQLLQVDSRSHMAASDETVEIIVKWEIDANWQYIIRKVFER